MPKIKELSVTLNFQDDEIDVTWSGPPGIDDGPPTDRFIVKAEPLASAGNAIRDALSHLQALDWPRPAKLSERDPDWRLGSYPEGTKAALDALAEAGRAQYDALFNAVASDPESVRAAGAVREWLEANVLTRDELWHVHFIHDDFTRSINPWGLTYFRPENSDQPGDAKFESFSHFWCTFLRLSCADEHSKNAIKRLKHVDRIEVIGLFENDEGVFDALMQSHQNHETTAKLAMVQNRAQREDVSHRMRKQEVQNNRFFYSALRKDPADAGAYSQDSSTLSADEFRRRMLKPAEADDVLAFIFLDGDAIIRHDRGAEWVSTALEFGGAGLIAVETDIENPNLRLFGWNIARDLWLADKPLVEAVFDAREKFWPLSLLYGVYCDPSAAIINPPPRASIDLFDLYITTLGEKS